MFWIIVKREIQEYLKSSKLLIGIFITTVLITISTIININDFEKRNQDYLNARDEMQESSFRVTVFRPPQVLSTLVQGKDRKLGNWIEFSYLNLPDRTSGYMGELASQHHRYLSGFDAIDFAFVIRVIMSLVVIFLAYNVISEEKTLGTLKLMLANRLPRDQLLLGKFLGGLAVISSALLLAVIMSLLIFLLHPAISSGQLEWIRLLAMMAVSALYLICFYTLCLFISVRVNRPHISLMVLLQLWIFLIIIYPDLGIIIAENWYNLPNEIEISQQKEAAFQPYQQEYDQVRDAFHNAIISGGNPSPEISKRNVELSAKMTELHHQVDVDFSNKLTNQMKLAQTLSILSPAVLYDQIMLRYARTGMAEYDRFMDGIGRYWYKYLERQKLRNDDYQAYKNTKLDDFSYPSETNLQSFLATLPQFIILFLLSMIFFVLAHISFLRKDVR